MAKIFISFIHEEVQVAQAVKQLISRSLGENAEVFLASDPFQVFAGDDWLERIALELREARIIVLMLSERSVGRAWVSFEAGAAWIMDKRIIPACFCGLSKGSLPKPYSNLQALDLPGDAYYIIQSIVHDINEESPFQLLTPPPFHHDDELVRAVARAIELCSEH